MLNIQTFVFNPFRENTHLLINEKNECWIVDPGMFDTEETNYFIDHINKSGFKPQAIINTHTHIDHILGVQALTDAYKIPFGMHLSDVPVLNNAMNSAAMFGFQLQQTPVANFYIDEHTPFKLVTIN